MRTPFTRHTNTFILSYIMNQPGKQPHILSASSSLLGICFVLITALKLSRASLATYADEISIVASFILMLCCLFSYLSLRGGKRAGPFEKWADYLFLTGMLFLFIAVTIFATGIL